MSGTDLAYGATSAGYSLTFRCAISLRFHYAMSGTDIPYGASFLRACYAMRGTDLAYDAISLRASFAKTGTDTDAAAIALRACYAKCGTDIVHRCRTERQTCKSLRSFSRSPLPAYALPMRCRVQGTAVVDAVVAEYPAGGTVCTANVFDFADQPLAWVLSMRYAMRRTELAYGATRLLYDVQY
eukprot:1373078-Rhodomonas_salina.1